MGADKRTFIGIGSNMGDRTAHCVDAARRVLKDGRADLVSVSSLYLTSPVSPVAQPDFLNGAMAIIWKGDAPDLLRHLNRIELHMGRTRNISKGPREIDLDILLMGDVIVDTPDLTIPHPELHRRKFALLPCIEMDESILHPLYKEPLRAFLDRLGEDQAASQYLKAEEVRALIEAKKEEGEYP